MTLGGGGMQHLAAAAAQRGAVLGGGELRSSIRSGAVIHGTARRSPGHMHIHGRGGIDDAQR